VIVETGLVLLAATGFVAYVVRGITGAASAILFNALFGLELALGLVGGLTLLDGLYWIAMGDMLASLTMLVFLRREIRLEPYVLRLLATSVPIAVVLALLLPRMDLEILTVGLGIVLLGSGLYLGRPRELRVWDTTTLRRRAVPFGVATGILSGLYGMPGPVAVVYLAHGGPNPSVFRARTTLVSSVWSSVRVVVLLASGAVGLDATIRFGVTIPVILAGLGLGAWLHPYFDARTFRLVLATIVGVAGMALLVDALWT